MCLYLCSDHRFSIGATATFDRPDKFRYRSRIGGVRLRGISIRRRNEKTRSLSRRLMAITVRYKIPPVVSRTRLSRPWTRTMGSTNREQETAKYLPREQIWRQVANLSYRKKKRSWHRYIIAWVMYSLRKLVKKQTTVFTKSGFLKMENL